MTEILNKIPGGLLSVIAMAVAAGIAFKVIYNNRQTKVQQSKITINGGGKVVGGDDNSTNT